MIQKRRTWASALSLALVLAPVYAPTASAQTTSKQQMHDEMRTLVNSKRPADLARLAQLSAALGGDLPVASGASTSRAPQGAPTEPPNCTAATTVGNSTGPVAIADVAASTSTLTVAGANTFAFRVSVTTNITHTFAADMDITVQSPAGTVVTLTTDNGAGNDNVFNGTIWTDLGSTPATDFVYANLVPATVLGPEEAMAAFYGEDPNGTWTLTVSDDLTGDTGSIDSWSVSVSALDSTPINTTTTVTNNTPVPIVDVATSTSTVSVAGAGTYLCSVTANANITHTFAADMDISLLGSAGGTVVSTDNGAGNDNVFNGTLWDDTANPAGQVPYTSNNGLTTDQTYANLVTATPLVPEGAFGTFSGINPNGTWTLQVVDDLTGDTGSIDAWTLNVTTCECEIPEADLTLTKSVDPPTVAPGENAVFTLTVSNAGPGNSTATVVTDTLPAGLSYVSNDCGATYAAPTVTWNVGTLAIGASAVCNVTVTVDEAGTHTNNAVATSNQTDPIPADNVGTATVGGQQAVQEIPTLNTLGLLALLMGLGIAGLWILRRRA
jgi:uncharacterized repeat protein (TIGR01451 family)